MARLANPLQKRIARHIAADSRPALPLRFTSPSERELRAQAVHRLQVGLFGLGGMLLMVGLANIVMERARQSEDAVAIASPEAVDTAPAAAPTTTAASDPLVDMGVAPELPVNKPSPSAKPDAMILLPGNAGTPTQAPPTSEPDVKQQQP
ncbi:hypothetical protein RXV95_12945 [Novosphingobium sp. ZN18A2]|uniref:hypothetical protein n=1 Tax=Novosphingobium sp. ZN18A2 TaxID=3079861 RepID=UPI0030D471FE